MTDDSKVPAGWQEWPEVSDEEVRRITEENRKRRELERSNPWRKATIQGQTVDSLAVWLAEFWGALAVLTSTDEASGALRAAGVPLAGYDGSALVTLTPRTPEPGQRQYDVTAVFVPASAGAQGWEGSRPAGRIVLRLTEAAVAEVYWQETLPGVFAERLWEAMRKTFLEKGSD